MAIQYVGGRDESRSGNASSGMSVALTSGLSGGLASTVSPGDLVIASFATGSDRDRGPFSISDGTTEYTLVGSELNASDTNDANLRVAYKFMADPVDATVEFGPSLSSNDAAACTVQVFRGVDPSTPLDVAAVTATGTNSARPNPGSITPSTAGAFIVAVGSGGHSSGPFGFTSSDLTAFRTDSFDDAFDVAIGAGYKEWTSGAFNPAQFGFDGLDSSSYSWCAVTLALRPAAATVDLLVDSVESGTGLSIPVIGQVHAILAADAEAASSLSLPAVAEVAAGVDTLLAADVEAAPEVSGPVIGQVHVLEFLNIETTTQLSRPALSAVILYDGLFTTSIPTKFAVTEGVKGRKGSGFVITGRF